MSDQDRLLELIEEAIVAHGGDLGGWTLRGDGSLQLFEGRATLRTEFHEAGKSARQGVVHAHLLTKLHDFDEELDACLMGVGDDSEHALQQIAAIWITSVAGAIKSLLNGKPVCTTCVTDDGAEGAPHDDYGFNGVRAFVGPSIVRGQSATEETPEIDASKPWFRFAPEAAAPRRIHLAKVTLSANESGGWSRNLEVDGHDVAHHDPDWPAGIPGLQSGYVTRFAVFEFPGGSPAIERRAELERTIRFFAENYTKYAFVDDLLKEMIEQGFDAKLVHETESFSTIAFSRVFFQRFRIGYPSTVIIARRDGRIDADVPLMSLPAYARARALAPSLRETMTQDDFQALCLYNAESNAIVQAMEAAEGPADLSHIKMYPCVVPEPGASDQTVNDAIDYLHRLVNANRENVPKRVAKKPWWKIW